MEKHLHFFIIDDDEIVVEQYTRILRKAGHKVTSANSSTQSLTQIIELQPDCILCDLLLPGVDGFELFQNVRKTQYISQPTFIIVTGKQFDYDKRRAQEIGVDGYITKPINDDTFLKEILEIIAGTMRVKFWGNRGTLPVPGNKSLIFGGNTNCITLRIARKHFFIFDAGTGIKELSNYLLKVHKLPLSAKIFISHPHYDHINSIPFFVPLYMRGNEFEIMGPSDGDITFEKLMSGQMDSVYFPITMKEFAAMISFRDLTEEEFSIDDVRVKTILLNHPGRCLGYRIEYRNKSFCYITDNELYLENSPHYDQFQVDRLINFIKDTNILVIDTTYSDKEYQKKVDWGHSCVSRVVDVADKANVKLLCLHHHDPDQTDQDIEDKLTHARSLLETRQSKTRCIAAHEGDEIVF